MRDVPEYLRAYRAYVSAKLSWRRALMGALVWLAGMFVPLWAKPFVQFPSWLMITWMIGWALLGYVFAPYGMWKHQRTQTPGPRQPDRN
jgi:fatty acid desaturase